MLVALAPTSAQVMGPVESRISPRGDHAPPGFLKSLDGVKGEILSASTTLLSHQRICTVGWLLWGPGTSPALLCCRGALAVGETTPPTPHLPRVNNSDKTKRNGESCGVPVPGTGDDGFFRQK